MSSLSQFSIPSPGPFGPKAIASVAFATTALLAVIGRAKNVTPASVRRRVGLPKGVVRWLLIGLFMVAGLLLLGIDLQGLWSTLVPVLSLIAVGFVAMWSILSHTLASVLIVVFRPFEVGDRVELMGDDLVSGEVTDLNPIYTTLRAEDGGTLQVPNNLFFQKAVKRHARTALEIPRLSLT